MLLFFDGFRASHEISKIEDVDKDVVRAMLDDELINATDNGVCLPVTRYCVAVRRTPMCFSSTGLPQTAIGLQSIEDIEGYDNWNAFFIMFCIKLSK